MIQTAASQHPLYPDAVNALHHSGAHFVLCKGDKTPLWTGYLQRRPPPEVVLTHLGPVGLVPWPGLRMTVADVDSGDYRNLTGAYPTATDYPTPRGQHLLYGDVEPRGNLKFKAHGCKGDIRGARGYVVLHGEAMLKLWGAVTTRRPPQFPFPVQLLLFTEEELGPVQTAPVRESPLPPGRPAKEWARLAQQAEDHLYTVQAGSRHSAHFDALRYWAYRWQGNMGADLNAWQARVYEVSDLLHGHIPVVPSAPPYSLTQARTNALSVATFMWSGRQDRPHDHSSEAQRRRALKRWHGRGDFMQELNVKAMHTAIHIDYGRGLSVSDIAQNSIYGPRHIQRIVKAERAKVLAQRNNLIRDHIAGGARVSKVAALFNVSRRQVYRILKV